MPEERRLRFAAGHNIGKMAHQLFPGGVNLAPPHATKYPAFVKYTKELIENQTPVLYEPSFIYNQVLVALDILVYDNGWKAYEVKSSVTISETYKLDAALQYHIITSSGLLLKDFSMIHLTKSHKEIDGTEDVQDLFQITSLKEHCENSKPMIEEQLDHYHRILNGPAIPKMEMGDHCSHPYDCDFTGFCKRQKSLMEAGRFRVIDM